MSLMETVVKQRLEARKAKDVIRTNILTTLAGELETRSKKTGEPITDDQVIAVAKKLIKSNNETIQLMDARGSQLGLVSENAILKDLLPAQMDAEEIRRIIAEQNLQGIPAVMQYLNSNYSGQFDKALASSIARSV